jgi:uncharacterized protein
VIFVAIFVVKFQYNVSRAQRESEHAAHSDYLHRLAQSGALLLAGPLVDGNGGLLIYNAENRVALQQILDDEPYVRAGFVADRRIEEWRPGKGSLWQTADSPPGTKTEGTPQ